MIFRILTCLIICFLFPLSSCSEKTHLNQIDANRNNIRLISEHGAAEFRKNVWEKGDSEKRGELLKSLFTNKNFVGAHNEVVFDLLGHSTCYIDYEDQPCYEIIYDDKFYFLIFYVYHSGDKAGKISNIKFFERD